METGNGPRRKRSTAAQLSRPRLDRGRRRGYSAQSVSHDPGPSRAAEPQAAQGATTTRTSRYAEEERRRPAPRIARSGDGRDYEMRSQGPEASLNPQLKRAEQPFHYPLARDYAEPDWTRLPGYRGVTLAQWEHAAWHRKNTVKNLGELKAALREFLDDELLADIERDQRGRAALSILITPHMINTMEERALREDPLRRYMLPAFSDRRSDWSSHPKAARDSLHEQEMWKVEGLTHRYPTKVLAE